MKLSVITTKSFKPFRVILLTVLAVGMAHAETPKSHAVVTVEKSASVASAPYQTGNGNIFVAYSPDSQAKLQEANGNVYALAINSYGVKRASGVVHVNGRTLLVADPSRYQEKVAKNTSPAPVTVATVK